MARMKDVSQVRSGVARRLEKTYVEETCGLGSGWPYAVSLGSPSATEILAGFSELDALIRTLRSWEHELGVTVRYRMREAGGPKRVPTHVEVPSMEVAVRLAAPREGLSWPAAVRRMRERDALLRAHFGWLAAELRASFLRATKDEDDLEFELLLAAGSWFASHDATGLSARQVPLPGIDGKWLNATRRKLVSQLVTRDVPELVKAPPLVEFAYLDPVHRASGGRHYDSWVVGDAAPVSYLPTLVIIVENKETFRFFPEVQSGICVFGSGRAGSAYVRELPWLAQAARIVYWGDLDADGFEILDGYRQAGLACESICMDLETLGAFGRFGTNLEKNHRSVIHRVRRELATLTDAERACYERITDEGYAGHRRLEQERIPLEVALAALG